MLKVLNDVTNCKIVEGTNFHRFYSTVPLAVCRSRFDYKRLMVKGCVIFITKVSTLFLGGNFEFCLYQKVGTLRR